MAQLIGELQAVLSGAALGESGAALTAVLGQAIMLRAQSNKLPVDEDTAVAIMNDLEDVMEKYCGKRRVQ